MSGGRVSCGRIAVISAAVLLAGCGARHGAATPANQVELAGCHMTVHLLAVDPDRVRGLVPARYRLGTYAAGDRATLTFWVMACDAVRMGASRPHPAILSLVGAQVRSPLTPSVAAGPARFDHYLLFAQANDPALVRALRGAGLPADLVRGMRFSRRREAVADVPWRRGAYQVRVHGYGSEVRHDHDNSYWHDGRAGASRLEVRLYGATDRACAEPCRGSGVVAEHGPIARLLDATLAGPPYAAIDHDRIATGDATVLGPRPLPRQAGFLGLEGVAAARGVRVTRVLPGEPAARAGLRGGPRGDVILAVDGRPVRDFRQLLRLVRERLPGDRARLRIVRRGARRTIVATLGQRPPGAPG
jgi:hypothetical protein